MYKEQRAKQSELFQLLILDSIYAQSESGKIIFQGGTALRWVYGAARFSEDLDFVTTLSIEKLNIILSGSYTKILNSCIAQFGPGQMEQQVKKSRKSALKTFWIYRPNDQRERIAVKIEFELLKSSEQPDLQFHVLRDLPQVAGLVSSGELFLPYTSSIIVAETPEEILSDKIRALFERKYIKGRDIYDVWWMVSQLRINVNWPVVQRKLSMYRADFVAARTADFFLSKAAQKEISNALKSDLPRFIPQNILTVYYQEQFATFIDAVQKVIAEIMDQGMRDYLKNHA